MLNGDAGNQSGMVSTFFRRVAKHFANEMAVVTPNGQLLSHDLDEGLKKWRALPANQRRKLDELGGFDIAYLPSPPPRGLVLKVFSRGLMRDDKQRLQIYKTEVARSLEPGRDHLWLTESDANSLVPDTPIVGSRKQVATPVVDRICRRYLIDLVRVGGNGGPRRPNDVLGEKLQVIVESATAVEIRLRLDGSARLATRDIGSGARKNEPKIDAFRLLGYASYDRSKSQFTSFNLIAFSETGHYDEIHKKVLPLGVLFEFSPAKVPTDRVPPSSYSDSYFAVANQP
ncbi:MAG: hypothetical protein ACI9G1_003584 [Pirellulaceae bacterium]